MEREFSREDLDEFFEGELRHAYEGKYKTAIVILMDPEEETEKYASAVMGYTHCRAKDLTEAIGLLEKSRMKIWLAEMRLKEDEED